MRTKTIEHGSMTVVLRPRTRFSHVRILLYKKALIERDPKLKDLQQPTDSDQLIKTVIGNTAEWSFMAMVDAFAELADRISMLFMENAKSGFDMRDEFSDDAVYNAFQNYLAAEDDDPDDLWTKIKEAVAEMSKPLTDAFKQPPGVAGELDPEAVGDVQVG